MGVEYLQVVPLVWCEGRDPSLFSVAPTPPSNELGFLVGRYILHRDKFLAVALYVFSWLSPKPFTPAPSCYNCPFNSSE